MNRILRNILAVISGILLGSIVNMAIVSSSGAIIPLPDGVDPSDMESLKNSMHLFGPQNFIMPFLAHALGTLVGALVTSLIAISHKQTFGLAIGFFFLLGGIANLFMLPSPLWFAIVDLALAYLPTAWFGAKLTAKFQGDK